MIKEGFGGYGHIFATRFLTDLFTFLWSILFIIPGIVAVVVIVTRSEGLLDVEKFYSK